MAKIHFLKKEIEIDGKKTILDYSKELGVYIDAPCDGKGSCGRCVVQISGKLADLTEVEKKLGLGQDYRLACQTVPTGDGDVYVEFPEIVGISRIQKISRRNSLGFLHLNFPHQQMPLLPPGSVPPYYPGFVPGMCRRRGWRGGRR